MARNPFLKFRSDVPLVDADGYPTQYFLEMMSDLIGNAEDTDDELTDAVPQSRAINAGSGLTGGGNLTEDRTISLEPQSLDDLTDVDLDTTPPTDNQVLVYDESEGKWVPANQSGGGGGGGDGWVTVDTGTLSGPSTLWRGNDFYYTDVIPLVGGDVIEMRAVFNRANGDECALAISPDGDISVVTIRQGDDNWVLYRFNTGGGGSILLSGGSFNVNDNFTEVLYLRMTVMDVTTGGSQGVFSREFRGYEKTASVTTGQVPLTSGSPRIYIAAAGGLSDVVQFQYRLNHGV